MYTETEGIIFKQIKTVNSRRMILLFSKKYGKISAGTAISERSRGKSALSMRPFTYGKYELYKNRDSYNINGAEVYRSYYRIGEDVEKYMAASYVLEFTERILTENDPAPELFVLLVDFFDMVETRKKRYGTLVIAYLLKALAACGHMPHLDSCVSCGSAEGLDFFDIQEGGLLCRHCRRSKEGSGTDKKVEKINAIEQNDRLLYEVNFGIINILRYFLKNPLKRLERLALDEEAEQRLSAILKSYMEYHLDIRDLKSERFILD